MMKLALLFTLIPMMSFGLDRMTALSMIESADNDRLVGRAGEISRYQILKREWRSVSSSQRYSDPVTARSVTRTLADRRVRSFQTRFGRPPTDFEFYGLWNAPAQVLNGRVSRRVAERCHRFANLCGVPDRPVQVVQVKSRTGGTSRTM